MNTSIQAYIHVHCYNICRTRLYMLQLYIPLSGLLFHYKTFNKICSNWGVCLQGDSRTPSASTARMHAQKWQTIHVFCTKIIIYTVYRLTHKDFFPLLQCLYIITSTTTTTMTATFTRPGNPKITPMAMSLSVDRPEGGAEERVEEGVEGRAEVVAGQVVEFSCRERRSRIK